MKFDPSKHLITGKDYYQKSLLVLERLCRKPSKRPYVLNNKFDVENVKRIVKLDREENGFFESLMNKIPVEGAFRERIAYIFFTYRGLVTSEFVERNIEVFRKAFSYGSVLSINMIPRNFKYQGSTLTFTLKLKESFFSIGGTNSEGTNSEGSTKVFTVIVNTGDRYFTSLEYKSTEFKEFEGLKFMIVPDFTRNLLEIEALYDTSDFHRSIKFNIYENINDKPNRNYRLINSKNYFLLGQPFLIVKTLVRFYETISDDKSLNVFKSFVGSLDKSGQFSDYITMIREIYDVCRNFHQDLSIFDESKYSLWRLPNELNSKSTVENLKDWTNFLIHWSGDSHEKKVYLDAISSVVIFFKRNNPNYHEIHQAFVDLKPFFEKHMKSLRLISLVNELYFPETLYFLAASEYKINYNFLVLCKHNSPRGKMGRFSSSIEEIVKRGLHKKFKITDVENISVRNFHYGCVMSPYIPLNSEILIKSYGGHRSLPAKISKYTGSSLKDFAVDTGVMEAFSFKELPDIFWKKDQ